MEQTAARGQGSTSSSYREATSVSHSPCPSAGASSATLERTLTLPFARLPCSGLGQGPLCARHPHACVPLCLTPGMQAGARLTLGSPVRARRPAVHRMQALAEQALTQGLTSPASPTQFKFGFHIPPFTVRSLQSLDAHTRRTADGPCALLVTDGDRQSVAHIHLHAFELPHASAAAAVEFRSTRRSAGKPGKRLGWFVEMEQVRLARARWWAVAHSGSERLTTVRASLPSRSRRCSTSSRPARKSPSSPSRSSRRSRKPRRCRPLVRPHRPSRSRRALLGKRRPSSGRAPSLPGPFVDRGRSRPARHPQCLSRTRPSGAAESGARRSRRQGLAA